MGKKTPQAIVARTRGGGGRVGVDDSVVRTLNSFALLWAGNGAGSR